jgi:hypothetical protein
MKPHCILMACLAVAAGTTACTTTPPFACGEYGPSRTISPSADLGLTAAAMIASPGQPNLPGSFLQAGWFLIDSFGTGALMGCRPATSVIQGWSQQNRYDGRGALASVTAQRYGSGPGTLEFDYEPNLPGRLQAAENFCMAIGGQKVRYSFTYAGSRLQSFQQVPDSGCPSPVPSTVSFGYADPNVPGLPTLMTVVQSGQTVSTVRYAYVLAGGAIQQVDVTPSDGTAFALKVSHTGGLVTGMQFPGTDLAVGYRNGAQWASTLDPRYGWGLTITYGGNNKVSATVQDTGCPGSCPGNTFGY